MMSHISMEGSVSSGSRGDGTQQAFDDMPRDDAVPPQIKRKRNLPGTPDPDAEVVTLSPRTLMATNRFVCEICNKGFQRDQNLQLHRRGHNLPWKLRQRTSKEVKKRVYVCPEPGCVHNHPSRALGDLTGIKKHFCRKHGEKKWKCDRCSKRYAVQSDWKAHSKTCGTREYRCDCGTLFSRRDSFITHRAFCDALAEETAKASTGQQSQQQLFQSSQLPINMPLSSLPLPLPFPPPSPRRVGSTGLHNASSMATPPLRLQEPNFNPFNPHHRQAEEASRWPHYPSNNTIISNNDLSSSARNSLLFSQAGPGPPTPDHFHRSSSSSSTTTSTPLQPSAFSGSSAFLGYPPKTMDGSLDDALNSTNRHNHNDSHSHSHSSSSNPFADAHSLEVMFGGMQDLANGLHWQQQQQQQYLQQQQLQQQQFKAEPSASSFNYPMQQQTTTANANTAAAAAQMHSSLLLLNGGASIGGGGGGGVVAQMSATSLLQKAAQMGATDSLYKSFGFPSTDIGGGNSNPSRLASLSRSSGAFGLSSILNKTDSCMMANARNSSRVLEEAVHSLATADATRLFESNPDQSFGSSRDLDQGSKGHMMRSRFPSFEPKFEPSATAATAATAATSSSSSSFLQGKSEEVLTRDFLGVGRPPPPHAGMHHTLNPHAGSTFFLPELANISSASASSSTPASLTHEHGAAAAAATAAAATHRQYLYHYHHHQDSSTS